MHKVTNEEVAIFTPVSQLAKAKTSVYNKYNKLNTICPVCGYNDFEYVPEAFDLCPCCFFTFYVTDTYWTYKALRDDWIERGALWQDGKNDNGKPVNWNIVRQISNLKLSGIGIQASGMPTRLHLDVYCGNWQGNLTVAQRKARKEAYDRCWPH